MPRANILSGIAFRSALISLVVFAVVLSAAGWVILDATRSSMDKQVKTYIQEDVNLLHDAELTGGDRELIRFVNSAVETRSDKQYAFGLFELSGKRISGNIEHMPAFRDWGNLALQPGQAPDDPPFLAYVERVGNYVIVVARSQRNGTSILDSIFNALIFSGIVIGMSALVIGYLSSRGVSRKLQVIDETLEEVSRGNTRARLQIGRTNDQIDHVSGQINAHLDRLDELMAGMRNTIVAVAHDLRSPLNRAYILLQEASAARDREDARTKLEDAQVAMDSLGELMDTVLRISRIESTDDSSSFATFSASSLARDLAQTFEPVLESAGQSLVCILPATDVQLFGDRRMVQQMLVNLIENAARYGGNGAAIEIAVEARPSGPTLIVADNGPGIPPERHEDVMRPFFRIATDRNAPGAGLGLALVKAVATRHHAQLELSDNKPGLRVSVSFPPAPPLSFRREPLPRAKPAQVALGGTPANLNSM